MGQQPTTNTTRIYEWVRRRFVYSANGYVREKFEAGTLNKRFQSGIAKEHAYRADLEGLIRELIPSVEVTNEPANVTDSGKPDFAEWVHSG